MFDIYTKPILQAFIFFPFVALFFTLPYMFYIYRKFGAFLFTRILIVYSFILYLMCAYFLVILPLPSMEEVAAMTSAKTQLIPFSFIKDILKERETSSSLLHNKAFLQSIFNIALVVPFGMYLRYYFQFSFKKTLLFSFLLTLFFECTQLSGLYFIYPRSYRLFDVDDLLLNTFGGVIGYILVGPFLKILPSRNQIDQQSLIKGQQVGWLRRCFLIFIDVTAGILIHSIFQSKGYNPSIFLIITIYLLFMTSLFKRSIGMICTNTSLASITGKLNIKQIFIRYFCMFIVYLGAPWLFIELLNKLVNNNIISKTILYIGDGLVFFYFGFVFLYSFIKICQKKLLFFEAFSKTKIISNIHVKRD